MTANTGQPDAAINNDIATVRDAFKQYEAETGVDPATLPREQQREIALGGLNALDQGAAPTASLSGKEVSESFNSDTAVADARAWFKANLQGRPIVRDGFGTVRVSSASFKKLKQGLTRDPLKLQLLPAIRPLIERGEYGGRRAVSKSRPDNIVAFHSFEGNVALGDTTVRARVLVGEDADGTLLFNLYPDSSTKKQTPRPDPRNRSPGAEGLPDEQAILNENLAQDEDGIKIIQAPAAGGVSDSGAALSQSGDDGFSAEGRRQFREVERAYGGRQGYERDKAAGRTKLTYGQWVQVRTPNFLRWFGDWLALQSRAFLDGKPVATLTGAEFASDGVPLTEKVPKWYADNGFSTVAVDGIGDVALDARAVKDSFSHRKPSRERVMAFAAVPDVLKKGRIISVEPLEGSRDGGMVYQVAAPVSMGGKDYIVDVMVKADPKSRRMYVHEVIAKEKLQQVAFKTGADAAEAGAHTGADTAGAIRSVLQAIYEVNPATVSKVIDPKTGEPLVVTHGSRKQFTVFNEIRGGTYFTEDGSAATAIFTEDGGGDVGEYFLSLKNPLDARWKNMDDAQKAGLRSIIESVVDESDIQDAAGKLEVSVEEADPFEVFTDGEFFWAYGRSLQDAVMEEINRRGYDGVIFPDALTMGEENTSFVAFNRNQIKSATANNGDFSEDPSTLKQADGNKKAPRGQIVGRDGQSIIGQKAVDGSREFNITLFEVKDLSTELRARRRQGEATRWHWTVQVQHEA